MEFKKGDRVVIRRGSGFYRCTESNPDDSVVGTVVEIRQYDDDTLFLPVKVRWDNGATNSYNASDLWFYEESPEEQGTARDILPSSRQVGGSHYQLPIQPIEYIYKNELSYFQGNVIKYITRYKDKNGKEDLLKAKQYIDFILEFEYPEGE